ncbi:GGDEF domain-containing response regulator [Desulfocicer niacini]
MSQKDNRSKVLIVDDNRQNIEMLMALFKDDYKIAAAINARRAMKIALSDAPPDLILMDILMPEMDGYELCATLKENPATKDIPIIFVTAVSEIMDENRGFNLGAVDYITKPFHPPVVKARVKLHLNLKRKQELLEKYAFIDALTEIPNRRRFDEILEKEWNRAIRSHLPLSLVMIDIDHFKYYNDTYGHGMGDECLKKVAATLEKSLRRGSDFVARYGGEEFMAILPATSGEESIGICRHIADNINDLAIEHRSSEINGRITVSMGGVTIQPDAILSIREFIEAADQKMYEAKAAGRNQIMHANLNA